MYYSCNIDCEESLILIPQVPPNFYFPKLCNFELHYWPLSEPFAICSEDKAVLKQELLQNSLQVNKSEHSFMVI